MKWTIFLSFFTTQGRLYTFQKISHLSDPDYWSISCISCKDGYLLLQWLYIQMMFSQMNDWITKPIESTYFIRIFYGSKLFMAGGSSNGFICGTLRKMCPKLAFHINLRQKAHIKSLKPPTFNKSVSLCWEMSQKHCCAHPINLSQRYFLLSGDTSCVFWLHIWASSIEILIQYHPGERS